MAKFKAGQKLTYKPHNVVVEVVHVTPYHEDGDEHAVVIIKTANGVLMPVPVKVQEQYLTTDAPVKIPVIKKIFGKSA